MKTNNLPNNVNLASMEFELSDVDVIRDILNEAEGVAFESQNAVAFALRVTVEGRKREWLTQNKQRRSVLAKYFFRLKTLMPNLTIMIEYAEVHGKSAEPTFADDFAEDAVYFNDIPI